MAFCLKDNLFYWKCTLKFSYSCWKGKQRVLLQKLCFINSFSERFLSYSLEKIFSDLIIQKYESQIWRWQKIIVCIIKTIISLFHKIGLRKGCKTVTYTQLSGGAGCFVYFSSTKTNRKIIKSFEVFPVFTIPFLNCVPSTSMTFEAVYMTVPVYRCCLRSNSAKTTVFTRCATCSKK